MKAPVPESFFNKVADLKPATLVKEIPAQVLPCEFCEIVKNTFFTEHLRMTAHDVTYSRNYFCYSVIPDYGTIKNTC